MRVPRFYCPDVKMTSDLMALSPQVHKHAIQVLRLKLGEELSLFDGKGNEFSAQLAEVAKRESAVRLIDKRQTNTESPLTTTLIQAISRGERMDYTIQKAVELGINRIIPVFTERCNSSFTGDRAEKKLAHWQGVIVSASEQCGRSVIPQLGPITQLNTVLAEPLAGQSIILDPGSTNKISSISVSNQVNLLIGPEGGLTEDEIDTARQSGFQAVQFGPRILRTETAAVAALSVIQTLWGDIDG